MALPLEGILVVDLTQNVAGPFCTQTLGDMGAEVVKVERPGRGDDARAWAPPCWGTESATFIAFNRNKRSLALDLKREGGLEVLRRLVARADVFVQSLRPGAIGELGLDFAEAIALNPRLVYCSITAFGTRGPLAHLPGYDPLMQAYAGLMSVNGHPGRSRRASGRRSWTWAPGCGPRSASSAGLRQRDATGRAVEVTTALFETALMWVSYHAMGYLGSGEVPQPQGSGTAMIAPYQAFPSADGYVMIGAASDALYARLTQALGVPELARDPRFADNPSRVTHRGELVETLSARTPRAQDRRSARAPARRRRPRRADPLDGPGAAVAADRGQRDAGRRPAPAPARLPLDRPAGAVGRPPPEVRRVPPRLGEHTADVLTTLGYTLDDVRTLQAQGLVQ